MYGLSWNKRKIKKRLIACLLMKNKDSLLGLLLSKTPASSFHFFNLPYFKPMTKRENPERVQVCSFKSKKLNIGYLFFRLIDV